MSRAQATLGCDHHFFTSELLPTEMDSQANIGKHDFRCRLFGRFLDDTIRTAHERLAAGRYPRFEAGTRFLLGASAPRLIQGVDLHLCLGDSK
jgi:hypothetical protein